MRKNIFLKSTIRQYVHTLILMALIGVAAFAFVLRTVEYIAVRSELERLGNHYRSTGFIRHPDFWQDVSEAAALLEESGYLSFSERRFSVEGLLRNMYNADIAGIPHFGARDGTPLRDSAAIMRGHFADVTFFDYDGFLAIWGDFIPDENGVLAGYPEHTLVTAWSRTLGIGIPLPDELRERRGQEDIDLEEYFLEHVGYGTILIRATHHLQFGWMGNIHLPRETGWRWLLLDRVICDDEDISEEVARLRHDLHSVNLQPVKDMTALPHVTATEFWQLGITETRGIESPQPFRLNRGRLLNYDDYINRNHVAVIPNSFAAIRDVRPGDTLVIEIPRNQEIFCINDMYRDFLVRSFPEDNPDDAYIIELEIVGVYTDSYRSSRPSTYGTGYIYIPKSILPDGFNITFSVPEMGNDYLPSIWFSYVLENNRYDNEQRFLEQFRPLINDMGLELVLFPSNSVGFWSIVDPIILTITFNAIVFWFVLILMCALVTFLFINRSRKVMAIKRAIGFTKTRIFVQLLITTAFFTIPGVFIGVLLGFNRAITSTQQMMDGVAEIVEGFTPAVELSHDFAIILGLIILVTLLLMVFASALFVSSFPVLTQLQGGVLKWRRKKRAASKMLPTEGTSQEQFAFDEASKKQLYEQIMHYKSKPINAFSTSSFIALKNSVSWIFKQMLRSPVKSALVFLVAAFLILTLGWLREAIIRTNSDIENLFYTTEITAEVGQVNIFEEIEDRHLGDVIWGHTIDAIRNKSYVTNPYIEAGHYRSFVIPKNPDGSFPERPLGRQPEDAPPDWAEIIGYDASRPLLHEVNLAVLDLLFAVNDLEIFIQQNTVDEEMMEQEYGLDFGLIVEFHELFNIDDFRYTPEDFENNLPVPVILPDHILDRWGFSLGDTAFIGYTLHSPNFWNNIPIIIIGRHNGQIFRDNAGEAALLPIEALEQMLRGMILYTSFQFTIDPQYNRYTVEIRQELEEIVSAHNAGLVRLGLIMSDHELHTLVGISLQTLTLLELIYPLAIITALIIAVGLALLLMLQNAKSAAVIRVLGASKLLTIIKLLSEHIIVCLFGAAAGIIVLALLAAEFGGHLYLMLLLYFSMVLIGAVTGLIIIINRTPISMLQVKE